MVSIENSLPPSVPVLTMFRHRVPNSASSDRKLCTGKPSYVVRSHTIESACKIAYSMPPKNFRDFRDIELLYFFVFPRI